MPYTRRHNVPARRIQAAWRAYAARKLVARMRRARPARAMIGDRVNSRTTKEYMTVDVEDTGFNNRTLIHHNLNAVPKSTTNDINERQRNAINLRGYKIYFRFQRVENILCQMEDLTLNVAVVSPRHDQSITGSGLSFFRDGTTNKRALDFNAATGRYDPLIYNRYPINPDEFVILKHKRYKIGRTTTDARNSDANKSSVLQMKWWVPLKRQIRYAGDAGSTSLDEVDLVYWYDYNNATSTTDAECLHRTIKCHTVFQEPRN